MKIKGFLLALLLLAGSLSASAAYFRCLPYDAAQPDGSMIHCFVSGDEYFNWLHDQAGYTIIQGDDGYFYWGRTSGDIVAPTTWRADRTDPVQLGLEKWVKISQAKYEAKKASRAVRSGHVPGAPHTGTLNNIVIYIRFSDDGEFTTTRQAYDNKFNPPTGNSMKSYYLETSYNNLTVSTTHYPECVMTTNYSYQDYHPRSYFQPYNAVTNPDGYMEGEAGIREQTMLSDAIDWINSNSPVPSDLNIDGDEDGTVDNVCFIVKGGNGAWADLLWAHMWVLFYHNVYINGSQVWNYTFQPESQVDVSTLCHEMFHALGAPDLYHYYDNGISPTGSWDIMCSGSGHMSAYMKWKYAQMQWVTDLPLITTSGTYTLHPMGSSATNNCYAIPSPYSGFEYFVVEYRKKEGTFEGTLPGSGLIVYRIDPNQNGNAGGPPDEVYLYRPNGTLETNGNTTQAHFSAGVNRTKINDHTNPGSFLQDGSPGGLDISNVTGADTTISFTVNLISPDNPSAFTASAMNQSAILLGWQRNYDENDVLIAYNTSGTFGIPEDGAVYAPGTIIPGGGEVIYNGSGLSYTHTGLLPQTHYYYKAWSVMTGNTYSPGLACDGTTLCQSITNLPFTEGFESGADRPQCWFENNGELPWKFTAGNGLGSGYGYPATAHSGERNACLVDETKISDTNMLTTPIIDLTGLTDVSLKFWLFMQRWGTRQDELLVYYRTLQHPSWILLQGFNTSVTAWTEETIPLPSGLGEIQIGFCGIAKWGLGICIDDIEISQPAPPTLTVSPSDQAVTMAAGTTTFSVACPIAWTATSDAPSWCTVTPSGTGDGTITATYTENPLYSKRIATITVTAEGIPNQTVTITQNASNISVGEPPFPGLRIYPNPSDGLVVISWEEGTDRITEISLSDGTGRELLSKKIKDGTGMQLDLSGFSPGAYFMKLHGESATAIRKIMITR